MNMEKPPFDFIKRKDGTSDFEDFLNSIPEKDSAKLLAIIGRTEEYGLLVAQRMEWIKKLDADLYE